MLNWYSRDVRIHNFADCGEVEPVVNSDDLILRRSKATQAYVLFRRFFRHLIAICTDCYSRFSDNLTFVEQIFIRNLIFNYFYATKHTPKHKLCILLEVRIIFSNLRYLLSCTVIILLSRASSRLSWLDVVNRLRAEVVQVRSLIQPITFYPKICHLLLYQSAPLFGLLNVYSECCWSQGNELNKVFVKWTRCIA